MLITRRCANKSGVIFTSFYYFLLKLLSFIFHVTRYAVDMKLAVFVSLSYVINDRIICGSI